MAYRFKKKESVEAGLKRIVIEQIDKSLRDLCSGELDPHEAVHEARKRFKKIRAVLRLARKPLGDNFKAENTAFRDMGRKLSELRDAEAMIETFDMLAFVSGETLSEADGATIREALMARRDRIAGTGEALESAVKEVCAELEAARSRVEQWPLEDAGYSLIKKGLRRAYARGQAALDEAYATRTDEVFHNWRKRVKDHWYHATLLRRVWPEVMAGYRESLDLLSDQLGDHHNLAVFRAMLTEESELIPPELRETLFSLVEDQSKNLEKMARKRGLRTYEESPGAWSKRFRAYWEIWRS